MNENLKDLTLEDIANVKIKAYINDPYSNEDDDENECNGDYYDVYILTYIKHIVRIKANLALHGGLYSNYFEKYEEEDISNIMRENLINKEEISKDKKKKKKDKDKGYENDKKIENVENKRDLNYCIKELLQKMIKSHKIRENKIFLVTGMLGCGKTTCVNLAVEYFNKFLQIERNIKNKKDKKNVRILSSEEICGKKSYKKTPYILKNYDNSDSYSENNKLKINFNEPLFNFTPQKKNTSNTKKLLNDKEYDSFTEKEISTKSNTPKESEFSLNLNIEQINNNIRNIFENNDLSPLRKNANIRKKIQFEEILKKGTSDFENDSDENIFNDKYKKIIEEIKNDQNEEIYIYTIRLSAYLYKDDLQCIKSIVTQLLTYLNKDEKLEGSLMLNDYVIKLENLLIEINNDKKNTLLIIENVEKFCLQNKQNLLYTLFDLMHKKNIFINIICLTNILDITETLEKRIKSRFTFEMIHISPILNVEEITKLVYKILYVNLDDFHLIKKYYSVYFTYNDLIKIQKFLQIYNSTMQKEVSDPRLMKQLSYDINYGLDIRHIYHTCVDAILFICEYKRIFNTNELDFQTNTLLDPDVCNSEQEMDYENFNETINEINKKKRKINVNNENENENKLKCEMVMEKLGFFAKEKINDIEIFKERQGKLIGTPIKRNKKNDDFNIETEILSPRKMNENIDLQLYMNMEDSMSPRKLKENLNKFKKENVFKENYENNVKESNVKLSNAQSEYILNNVQSKFIRRHYIKKVLRDLSSIEYMILCAFTRLYKKNILPKTLYVIILEINKFKQAYPQEQIIGFSYDAYRRSFFRLIDLDIIILSSYSLNHLNIKNYSNDTLGLHEPTKFPCYDIFLDNLETYNLNHNLIQWVKHTIEVMQ